MRETQRKRQMDREREIITIFTIKNIINLFEREREREKESKREIVTLFTIKTTNL